MKKLIFCFVIVFLFGCSNGDSYGVIIKKEEQQTDYSTVYAEITEFRGIKNKDFEMEFNLANSNDIWDAIGEFDAIAQEAQDTLPEGVKSSLFITQSIKRNSDGIISLVMENYTYTGGAHGVTSWYPKTVNTRDESPHILSLGELFADDNYIEGLNRIIKEKVNNEPERYSELWAEPIITKENENRFYLTDDCLVIYFPPYELSYYAKGFIEFEIPYIEINRILQESYKVPQ